MMAFSKVARSHSPSRLSGVLNSFQKLRPKKKRQYLLLLSFNFFVLLPVFIGSVYLLFFASPRYTSSVAFSVRSIGSAASLDIIGSVTGLSGGASSSDSYIILEYLNSRSILERLQKDFPFEKAYSSNEHDYFRRMRKGLSIEEKLTYWQGIIKTNYEISSGIISFEVQAFSPEDAKKIADLILGYAEELVNSLSEKEREALVQFAESETLRSEKKLKEALENIRAFQEREGLINPAISIKAQLEIVGALLKELASTQTRIAILKENATKGSPILLSLKRKASALQSQIKKTKRALSRGVHGTQKQSNLSSLLADFEVLGIEKEFAQKRYIAALATLEQARVSANKQQKYLAVYDHPALAQNPLYPKRLLDIVLFFIFLFGLWSVGVLLVYAVRDHAF